jgi:hypothetical protein
MSCAKVCKRVWTCTVGPTLTISDEKSKTRHIMAGYSGTPLVRKLGIRPNEKIIAINPPTDYAELLEGLPDGASLGKRTPAKASFVRLFATERAALVKQRVVGIEIDDPADGAKKHGLTLS